MAHLNDVAILVPMLGRPHRVVPLLESIRMTAPTARVLFLCSPHDTTVHMEIDWCSAERLNVPYTAFGDYARKINAGYRHTTEPLLFLGADDLQFLPGWLEAARAQLRDGIGVVGTNDMGSPRVIAGEHSTHSLVTRDYADRYGTIDGPGAILCELYWHEYVDDELVGTAKHRSAYAHAGDALVKHRHPNWDPSVPLDDLYRQQRVRMNRSAPLFRRRSLMWT